MQSDRASLWPFSLVAFLFVFFLFLNAHYPIVGHDYAYVLPRLVAGKWHFLHQGIFPWRFSPHFCAGFPQYGNPQDMFYSLPQFLALLVHPWLAVQGGIAIVLLIGYAGWYRLGKDILLLPMQWAHLFSLIIIANGFFLVHMIAGHLMFHTLPLIGWLLWFLLPPSRETMRSLAVRGMLFGIVIAVMLYSGGFLVVLIAGMACLFALPFVLLLERESLYQRLRVLCVRIGVYGFITLLLAGSKLIAVYSLMRFFPRLFPFDRFDGDASVFLFILRAFWALPQKEDLFTFSRLLWPVHEYSMLLSPVILFGVLITPVILWLYRGVFLRHPIRTLLCAIYGVFCVFFFVQLTRGYGVLVTPLSSLPIFQSLHVTVRFLYVFSIALVAVGICNIVLLLRSRLSLYKYENLILLVFNLMTIFCFAFGYMDIVNSNAFWMQVYYPPLREALWNDEAFSHPVSTVEEGNHNLTIVQRGVTSVRCHEPLFGYGGEHQISSVVPGSVYAVEDEVFNMHNPVCFQYPKENSCSPGDRIAISDRENFENFLRGEKVTWRISPLQRIADWITGIMLLLCLLLFAWKGHSRFSAMPRTAAARADSVFRS